MPLRVIYAFEDLPETGTSAIFLAGPTPRAPIGAKATPSWRHDAIAYLHHINYDGDVLIPEPRDGWRPDYDGQVTWECEGRRRADLVVFWVPRDLITLPAFTTNIEFGEDLTTGRIVYGRPDDAPKNRYLDSRYQMMGHTPHTTLESLLDHTVALLGKGATRSKGERSVPLWIWQSPSFQTWYDGVKAAGNVLNDFQCQMTLRYGPGPGNIFGWAGKVNVTITAENRTKTNESVVGRVDTAIVVPFLTDTPDNDVLITKEFRSPANTSTGHVWEPPAGSSPHTTDPKTVAAEELLEEAGLDVTPDRLIPVGTKQVAPTMLSHRAHVFALKLTPEESRAVRESAVSGDIYGVNPDAQDGERITLTVLPQNQLLQSDVDWGVMGAILAAAQSLS